MQRNYYIIYFLICLYVLWPGKKGTLWGRGTRLRREGSEGKVLKMDRPLAGGFLSLTGLWPEGCGGGFAADYKKSRPTPSVISTEVKRSGEISFL